MEDGVPELQAADRQVCGVHLQAGFPDNAGSLREGGGGGVTYPSCGPAHSTCDYSGNPSPTDGQSKKKIFFQRAKLYVFIA